MHYYNIIIVSVILKRYTTNLSPNPCDIISEPRVLWCGKEAQNFNQLNVYFRRKNPTGEWLNAVGKRTL